MENKDPHTIPAKKILIGITGHDSSGKDTVAEYLAKKYDMKYISTGDYVREHIKNSGLGVASKELMQKTANMLRTTEGSHYFLDRAMKDTAEKLIVGGLCAPAEITAIKEHGGVVIAVTAPLDMRYERLKKRGRIDDEISLEEFKRIEESEATNRNPNSQNLSLCVALSDHRIVNAGTIPELEEQADNIAKRILK